MTPWIKRNLLSLLGLVAIPGDPAALERGRYLFASRGCAANPTSGSGSAMPHYASADQFIAMLRSG